jgi:hypothetical protein
LGPREALAMHPAQLRAEVWIAPGARGERAVARDVVSAKAKWRGA